jgi:hypothetical protein
MPEKWRVPGIQDRLRVCLKPGNYLIQYIFTASPPGPSYARAYVAAALAAEPASASVGRGGATGPSRRAGVIARDLLVRFPEILEMHSAERDSLRRQLRLEKSER